MQFELKGRITFSSEIEKASKDIDKFILESNDKILVKGAPVGKGAKVNKWKIQKNTLQLNISSDRYVRAHDALLRLKKGFSDRLGKKYHIGARSIFIRTLEITFRLERKPKSEFSIPFVESMEFKKKDCTMKLKNLTEEFLKKNYIDRMIHLVREKVEAQYYEGKAEFWESIWESKPKKKLWDKDPTEEMLKIGWLKQGLEKGMKGKWFYGPQVTAIMRTMEMIAIQEILNPLGFQEIIEQNIVPFDIWLKTGHMEGVPSEIYYVSEPKSRDPKDWEYFKDYLKITKEIPTDELLKNISEPSCGLCYAQCPMIYWYLSGRTIDGESLPALLYDRTANSGRYESGGRHGIERVDEFHRIETVYIGKKEQLIELKRKMIEKYKYIFNEILDLDWRIARVTPFYMQQAGVVGIEDEFEKDKGTIDFEAYLPYRGDRNDKQTEWLEFQNLSIMGDKYTKSFNIKSQKDELWSGCSGIGLERWTVALLAQKGLDPYNWPDEFKNRIGKLPKGLKFL